jgi:hypothetical protein
MAMEAGPELDELVGALSFGLHKFDGGEPCRAALLRPRGSRHYTHFFEFTPSTNIAHAFEAQELVPESERDDFVRILVFVVRCRVFHEIDLDIALAKDEFTAYDLECATYANCLQISKALLLWRAEG